MSGSPTLAVAGELGRALVDLMLLPFRSASYSMQRRALEGALAGDLATQVQPDAGPPVTALPTEPLRIFVSAAEHSGELHAAGWVRALRRELDAAGAPSPILRGLGGARLEAEGVELVGRPVERSAMGFDVLSALPYYLGLLREAARELADFRPHLCLPVDSPALHVPLGRLARNRGARVVHFVTPQYWGWAPWRVAGYREAVDLALTILPFERSWFARHRVAAAHVGHPLLDRLSNEPDGSDEEGVLVLLPGSRESVVARNLPWMLARVARLRQASPELRVVVPAGATGQGALVERCLEEAGASDWAAVGGGELHETLAGARAAFSVSGTVLLDLLHHRLPTVVLYRLSNPRQAFLYRHFLTVPHFASVNLLAGRELLPEFCFAGEGPHAAVEEALERAWSDADWRRECRAGLEEAAQRLGPPGALARAARQALGALAPATRPQPVEVERG